MLTYQVHPRRYRAAEALDRQGLWPRVERQVEPAVPLRLRAWEEVLCRLPPPAYETLRAAPPRIQWRTDGDSLLGRVRPPSAREPAAGNSQRATYIVELAEGLEIQSWAVIVTVVAHEVAHVVLNHVDTTDPWMAAQQEIEAWNAIRQWGFRAEADLAEFLLVHQAAARP
jgi:hypothetical protein